MFSISINIGEILNIHGVHSLQWFYLIFFQISNVISFFIQSKEHVFFFFFLIDHKINMSIDIRDKNGNENGTVATNSDCHRKVDNLFITEF